MSKSYTPTTAMRNNARRGLALRDKYKRGTLGRKEASSEGVTSGLTRARQIIDGDVSLDTVKAIYSYLSRNEGNASSKKKESDGGPTAGYISHLIWGGSAGLSWARSILRSENILKSYTKEITQEDLDSEDKTELNNLQIMKSVNEELKQATFVVLEPQDADMMTTDLHEDWYDENEVRKAMINFNKFCMKASILHLYETADFEFIESYLSPVDMIIGEKFVKKGTWLATIQANTDELWQKIKDGTFNGLSIQATARVEKLT